MERSELVPHAKQELATRLAVFQRQLDSVDTCDSEAQRMTMQFWRRLANIR